LSWLWGIRRRRRPRTGSCWRGSSVNVRWVELPWCSAVGFRYVHLCEKIASVFKTCNWSNN
jgi:hypothetical protein